MPQYNISLCVDWAVIGAETNNYTAPFWFSSILVIFMSVFIIYTSFNLIGDERINLLGILRGVGCSRKRINRIHVTESMAIGLFGSAIGCIMGVGVLYLIKSMFFSANNDIEEASVVFGLYEIIFTLVSSALIILLTAKKSGI